MIATVTFASGKTDGAQWTALAIYPNGVRPERLELYPAAYVGDGAELTGVQVLDEFETMSGPVIVVPASIMGRAYDGALTLAFERDGDLAVGSGWPPIVVGLAAGVSKLSVEAPDLEPLFRLPALGVAWSPSSDPMVAFGYATRRLETTSIEAFVAVVGTNAHLAEQCVGVVVTDCRLGPRELRLLAASTHRTLSGSGASRRLAIAISTAEPIEYKADPNVRRALEGISGPPEAENAASLVAHAALVEAVRSRSVR